MSPLILLYLRVEYPEFLAFLVLEIKTISRSPAIMLTDLHRQMRHSEWYWARV